jgi:hypothetical protein
MHILSGAPIPSMRVRRQPALLYGPAAVLAHSPRVFLADGLTSGLHKHFGRSTSCAPLSGRQ